MVVTCLRMATRILLAIWLSLPSSLLALSASASAIWSMPSSPLSGVRISCDMHARKASWVRLRVRVRVRVRVGARVRVRVRVRRGGRPWCG